MSSQKLVNLKFDRVLPRGGGGVTPYIVYGTDVPLE